jgi:hypothetical protein
MAPVRRFNAAVLFLPDIRGVSVRAFFF